jgi:hypothetical protein
MIVRPSWDTKGDPARKETEREKIEEKRVVEVRGGAEGREEREKDENNFFT